MSTHTKTASLSGGLLARKGGALPAKLVAGQSCKIPQRPPAPQPVADRVADPVAVKGTKKPKSGKSFDAKAYDGEERARITLRLDPDRHLKLKLAGAHLRRSAQQILVEALDSYLKTSVPILMDDECGCLKSQRLESESALAASRKTPSWDN